MGKITAKFSVFELIIIAAMAALGIAVKPVIGHLARLITGPLAIPGGVLAGGLYMMFLVLAYGLTRGRLAGTLTALVQALIVMISGIGGSHGIMSLITYIPPGLAVDLVMLLFCLGGKSRIRASACFCAGIAANLAGTFMVGMLLFNIPLVPLLLSLSVAALSGGLGGLLSCYILKQIYKTDILSYRE
jgi:hypothetical protein